ncbi:serine/threonine-protein phosphatase [Actinoplanes sp. NEAU-A12]|uniref:Serine/threonine-protein phosphatase n=1 Tax=Actinoplanes sandaracinus TaxID=3045177 RepID=A0ABT6WQZ6_9ACTN|nr:PP2C family serine/threonine-protein phosphatase [Actinoplanes sandaracinus]MDI6102157.1 serine/threonine-protein phosphatase [Actinoplanes sandaracinus]
MAISTAVWAVAGRRLACAAGTVVGDRYHANFDVLHLDPGRPLAVVADGMGDSEGSAVASRTTVTVFAREAATASGPAALRAAVAEVQRTVRAAGRNLPGLTGCTLTAFAGDGEGGAWLVQLGDSRAYRIRDGILELLTADHTAAWLGVLNGWYRPDSPEGYLARHRLTRFAGHPGMPEPDLLNISLRPGDLLLLCTDGVSDQIDDRTLADLLTAEKEPAATVERVLARTLAAGGADNATAVVIRVG